MKRNSTLKGLSRASSRFAKVCSLLALLLLTTQGAWAQGTITFKEGTEDATNWTVKSGETTVVLGETEVAKDAPVTATYSGTKHVKSVTAVVKGPEATPLTLEAITAGSIVVNNPQQDMQYTLNGGAKTAMTATTTIEVKAKDKVAFYGKGTEITSYNSTIIAGSGEGFQCKVYGNIMSLLDETGFETATKLSGSMVFKKLFSGNTTLTDASGLLLPATTLTQNCYYQMFDGCSALTSAPALPATTLTQNCYYQMFNGCSALNPAPALPATELANNCYRQMFNGCTALTTAPALPATTLTSYCYYKMFLGCTSLTAAPTLPATTLVANCYGQMFDGCTNLSSVTCLATSNINNQGSTYNWLNSVAATGTFTAASAANWGDASISTIPEGWTRVDYVPSN